MEIALVALGALALGVAAGFGIRWVMAARDVASAETRARKLVIDAQAQAEEQVRSALLEVKEEIAAMRREAEEDVRARREESRRREAQLAKREEAVEANGAEVDRASRAVSEQGQKLDRMREELARARDEERRHLERVARMTAQEAKDALIAQLKDQAKREAMATVREIEQRAREEAEARARKIVTIAIQRVASEQTAESTVSVFTLPSDDLKGRIIGREGRNIRALENLTGVDFIIDDTPQAVVLSSFDGVRREVAKLTLAKLVEDGRIHPSRIEEMYYRSKAEIEDHIRQAGEQAVFEANCGKMHEELVKVLGRLRYRTSYGQNILRHSLECAHLAGIMASELGASVKTAKRAALLHDLGKAMTHEIEGSHALISAQMAKRYGESQHVVHAVEAHHYEVQPQTVEAVLVIAADAISASRPGARGESLEHYIKRLETLEQIAAEKKGVERVYALQAGREIRVMVKPTEIDDDTAVLLSHEIAREIEEQLEYPGQIKVTVIRESRAIEFAK